MRPVETQYFASPKIKTQNFAAPYKRNILRLPQNKNAKYCVSTICPVQTQNIASLRYAMAAAMNRGFPTFVF
jgi:hypothetical protein